jgi:hypothetical protein
MMIDYDAEWRHYYGVWRILLELFTRIREGKEGKERRAASDASGEKGLGLRNAPSVSAKCQPGLHETR